MLGQYFTTNTFLKQTVRSLILNNPQKILEPSVGRGDLLIDIQIPYDAYEIDQTLDFKIPKTSITFGDFLKQEITQKYTTIIGNPPFLKTTKCIPLITDMLLKGHFTHVMFPNNENLFENAAIDVMVFRYQKGIKSDTTIVNNIPMFLNFNGIVTFSETKQSGQKISDLFDVYVGIVSGLDSVFENEMGSIDVLVDQNKTKRMILINEFPTHNQRLNEYMLKNKQRLLSRRIRKFNETNWFEWGALRNIKTMTRCLNKPCIYIRIMTRKPQVAFVDHVRYFGGTLLMLIPKKDIDIHRVCNFFNSDLFKINFMYSGRFKITHNQVCSSLYKKTET